MCSQEVIMTTDRFMQAAIDEARKGLAEGGIPIGSVLVHDGKIIGRGHNRRVQQGSAILHGEMDALENAGRQPASVYRKPPLYHPVALCHVQRRDSAVWHKTGDHRRKHHFPW
jgi:cytosine deaminase